MPHIVPLSAIEPKLIEDLLDLAFEPARRTRTAYRIREGTEWLPALSFAALDDEDYLVATIQLWPVALTDPARKAHPLVMVGPVAVLPALQGEGYGKALIAAALGALDPASPIPQVLIGDAPYYERFGFSRAPRGWRCPGPWDPSRLLVRDLPADFAAEGMLGPWSASGLAN
jgi:predicted N-acetyltransferase YhbS